MIVSSNEVSCEFLVILSLIIGELVADRTERSTDHKKQRKN